MRVWRRIWHWAGGWLSQGTDVEILTRYVEMLRFRAELIEDVPRDQRVTYGSHGQPMLHPLLRELNTVNKDLLSLESRLGFTPADRSRIGVAEVKAASTLDALNEKRDERRRQREAAKES